MPSKKPHSKKTTPRKKKSVRAQPMPSLIFGETTMAQPSPVANKKTTAETRPSPGLASSKKTDQETKMFSADYQERQLTARRWMWLGVISFSAIIFILWGWSLWFKFSSTNWNRGSDYSLVKNAERDLNQIFSNQTTATLIPERDRTQLKEALRYIVDKNFASTTLTTSSTTESAPTTTSTIASSTAPSTTTNIKK